RAQARRQAACRRADYIAASGGFVAVPAARDPAREHAHRPGGRMSQPVQASLSARMRDASGRRPFRYLVAAGMNTAFGLAIYPALLWTLPWLRVHYMVGLFIAQAVSLCFAYSSYKLGVFQTRGGYARELTAFLSFYGVNYAA